MTDLKAEFDLMTRFIHLALPHYKFEEFKMPHGQIERWWYGPSESLAIRYKKDQES